MSWFSNMFCASPTYQNYKVPESKPLWECPVPEEQNATHLMYSIGVATDTVRDRISLTIDPGRRTSSSLVMTVDNAKALVKQLNVFIDSMYQDEDNYDDSNDTYDENEVSLTLTCDFKNPQDAFNSEKLVEINKILEEHDIIVKSSEFINQKEIK